MDSLIREKEIAFGMFEDYLKQHNMRMTEERALILDTTFLLDSFFDVQMLHAEVMKRLSVSLATIYSTLEILQDCRLVIRHNFFSKLIRYERVRFLQTGNYYRICLACHSVKKFKDTKLQKSISLRNSDTFRAVNQTLYLYGYCRKCQTKNSKEKK